MSDLADHPAVTDRCDPVVESFEGFYAREYRPVLAIALALSGSRAEAEDITQEAFVAAYAAWTRITNPSGWIRVTLTRKAISSWRRTSVARKAEARLEAGTQTELELPEDTSHFWNEVKRLPGRQAQAILLHYLEDRPAEEIAAMLGCEASTVRIHLSRGRRTLAARLGVTP